MTLQQSFAFEKPSHTRDGATSATPQPQARRNLVIEAGAGTGKTTAIVAEVLNLMLEQAELQPERIVLMTFTEKAAGEIADRIRTALEELGQALSDDSEERVVWPANSPQPLVVVKNRESARRAVEHHLANIDALRSQTIHSFCQSLLRTFPIEAHLDPRFKIVEGFERSLLYGQLYDAWIDDETRLNPTPQKVAEWELLFTFTGGLYQIRELVLALLDRRDLLGEQAYDFGDYADVKDVLEDAIHAIRECKDDKGDADAQQIYAYVRRTAPSFDTLEQALEYLRPIAANIRRARLPGKGVLKDALNILRAGDKGNSIYDRLVSHQAALALLSLTRRFVDFLDAEKRKLGLIDFDDLLLRTLALLDDPVVLERAREQFDYIFVDEFQDTDRTQARIIDRLARDASGAFVPGKTIVVGDPKQSIYGFRRADPETYYRMTEQLTSGGAERRVISDQYRSDPPLLEVINAMFSRLFPDQIEHDPNVFHPAYNALTARAPQLRRELDARVTMLHAVHDEKSDRFFAEAEAIAEWIVKEQERESSTDLLRFAILFRRLTQIDDYLDTLERYHIRYALPPTKLFLDRPAPVDMLAVLRAIAWPFDRGAQISAARTPYFALTDVEIAASVDPETEAAEWNAFAGAMQRFREAAPHLTVSQLMDLIIETTGIEHVYAMAADSMRNARHLEHLRSIAHDYDLRSGGSVRQFVDEIARRRDEPEEAEPVLSDESENAVRIMSVHAAKGLEFDTVILPDLAFDNKAAGALQLFTVEQPQSLVLSGRAQSISANFRKVADEPLKKIAGQRGAAELHRLFYVAVTRAKTDVVFVCNMHEKTKNTGFFKCTLDALGMDRGSVDAFWPDSGRVVHPTSAGPVAFERVTPRDTLETQKPRLIDQALEATLASSPIVALHVPLPEPLPEPLTQPEIAARRAGSRNRAAGILLHRVLEQWDGRSDVAPLLRRLAVEAAADSESVTRVRKRLATIAKSPMLERIAVAETVGREVPLRFVEDGVIVERRIDLLMRENGLEVVVDYKSGKAERSRVARDRMQVERYCRAVSEITGRACSGLLWYVDLEGDEVVELRIGN